MTSEKQATEQLDCELCIVGAGYAAMNALNAAAEYLPRGARVVVIDKRETWGGQWLHQYEFVRLHQPYRTFTAGTQAWTLQRDPSHLATRREVLDHLASVPSISAGHLEIEPLFGHVYEGYEAREGRVEVSVSKLGSPPSRVRVRAKRLLLGTGMNIEPLPRYPFSGARVRSLAVSDPLLMSPEFLHSDAPVYIIGSGKTAMDCARHVIQHRGVRRRPLNVIAGSGMYFFSRDNIYPGGARRYYGGTLSAEVFLQGCDLYTGHNEVDVMRQLERRGYFHNVWGFAGNCRAGVLSLSEREELRLGVDRVFRGHLVDVDNTRMTLRQGSELREHDVPEGAYFINCTSHILPAPHMPVLQAGGLVMAPQFALGLSGMSAYFLTHAWYLDRLHTVASDLFRIRLDDEVKLKFLLNFGLMIMANITAINQRLPVRVASRYEGDTGRWYPLYRRVTMLPKLMRRTRMLQDRAERILKLRFSDPVAGSAPALAKEQRDQASA